MKRFSIIFALAIVLLLGASVFAQTNSMPEKAKDFVKNIAIKKGVSEDKIESVEKVDMNNLPEEVNLQNIDETNLQMYKINLGKEKPVYVITASNDKFKKELQNFADKMLLNFGFAGKIENSTFLMSSTGVQGSYEKGYVMIRGGSITGLSTNLELENDLEGEVAEIIIYKNGKATGFRNTITLDKKGSKIDYDTMDKGTLNFEKGDVISSKILLSNGAKVKDVNTLLEIIAKA